MSTTHVKSPGRGRYGNPLHMELARRIGTGILDGTYQPGTLLPNEAEWGAMFGASRTSVREAMKTLAGKGLLVPRPRVGSRVEPREHWNLLDRDILAWHSAAHDHRQTAFAIQDLRRVIEPGVAELAAKRRTARQLARIARAQDGLSAARTPEESALHDADFHTAVLHAANNMFLIPFGAAIDQALRKMFELTSSYRMMPPDVIAMHRDIHDAIAARDGLAARTATLRLIEDTDTIIGEAVSRSVSRRDD